MKHEYTVEILYHFTCGRCKMWWSWADTPSHLEVHLPLSEDDLVFCPHCGFHTTIKIKDKFIN